MSRTDIVLRQKFLPFLKNSVNHDVVITEIGFLSFCLEFGEKLLLSRKAGDVLSNLSRHPVMYEGLFTSSIREIKEWKHFKIIYQLK